MQINVKKKTKICNKKKSLTHIWFVQFKVCFASCPLVSDGQSVDGSAFLLAPVSVTGCRRWHSTASGPTWGSSDPAASACHRSAWSWCSSCKPHLAGRSTYLCSGSMQEGPTTYITKLNVYLYSLFAQFNQFCTIKWPRKLYCYLVTQHIQTCAYCFQLKCSVLTSC